MIKMNADLRQIEGTEAYQVCLDLEGNKIEFDAESWADACARIESLRQEARNKIPVYYEGETYSEIRFNQQFGWYEAKDSKGYWLRIQPGLMNLFKKLNYE